MLHSNFNGRALNTRPAQNTYSNAKWMSESLSQLGALVSATSLSRMLTVWKRNSALGLDMDLRVEMWPQSRYFRVVAESLSNFLNLVLPFHDPPADV